MMMLNVQTTSILSLCSKFMEMKDANFHFGLCILYIPELFENGYIVVTKNIDIRSIKQS